MNRHVTSWGATDCCWCWKLLLATPLVRMSAAFGGCHRRLNVLVFLYFWQALSDIIHSCLIFKIFNLSALTEFNDFHSSVIQAPLFLWCVFPSSTSYIHAHTHTCTRTHSNTFLKMEYAYHGTYSSKEMRRLSVFVIYLIQPRRRLLYVMYISELFICILLFFCFQCNIIYRLVYSVIDQYIFL